MEWRRCVTNIPILGQHTRNKQDFRVYFFFSWAIQQHETALQPFVIFVGLFLPMKPWCWKCWEIKLLNPALSPVVGVGRVDRKIWTLSYLQDLKFEPRMRNMCRSGKEEGFLTVTITLNGCSRKIKNKPGEITWIFITCYCFIFLNYTAFEKRKGFTFELVVVLWREKYIVLFQWV